MAMRLDKYISAQTDMTRSEARAAINGGRVTVNGAPATDPARHLDESADTATLDGRPLRFETQVHLMLNKPAGVVTATRDPRARTVLDLLPGDLAHWPVTPVGRLDRDTTGLLILTTDGQLAHRLISPRHHVEKEYIARVDGTLDSADVAAFAAGMELSDFTALPARLEIIAPDTARAILTEGKYHQVKRMFAARGKPVLELRRVRMGDILLDPELPPGGVRRLTDAEAATLYRAAGL